MSGRVLPPIPQVFVIGGFKRDCPVTCDDCGEVQVFTVYADEIRDDEWCDTALAETMAANGWYYVENDYCPDCGDKRFGGRAAVEQ